MIVTNAEGKEVYKRRVIQKERVRKERPEGYYEEKQRALEERAVRNSQMGIIAGEVEAKEQRVKQYKNIFANFAANYAGRFDANVK